MKLSIKKGATVQVVAGAQKGMKGTVMEVNPTKMKIRIQGVKLVTHFDKKEGLHTKEGFIDYSNVKLVEAAPQTGKAKKAGKKKASAKA